MKTGVVSAETGAALDAALKSKEAAVEYFLRGSLGVRPP